MNARLTSGQLVYLFHRHHIASVWGSKRSNVTCDIESIHKIHASEVTSWPA
jgi:hypothetical protein